ncbi:MAG: hypothetical protein KAT15_32040 [Bacteroidales bacterium]|nr:hypothetical protein [Bacteroidales bacterium]
MFRFRSIPIIWLFLSFTGTLVAQDSLMFKGQLSAWALYNGGLDLPVYMGGRYIPQLNYEIMLQNDKLIDFEASANINGNFGFHPFDTLNADGKIAPYRIWGRYSSRQFEVRAGLQKINFGSANLLRPLMWFDEVDPRDPLNLTDGVWGVLARYYFLNNANIWLWGLYGDDKTKGWEVFPSKKNSIEYGGRVQVPLYTGEVAASYHHRTADANGVLPDSIIQGFTYPENRFSVDAKIDLGVGLWVEAALIHQDLNFTELKYRSLLNAGMDYTFNLGNGLNMMTEVFGYLQGDQPLGSHEKTAFGLLSATYPINIIHNISAMVFYDFTNKDIYRFINWGIAYDKWSFYVMTYWNPENYNLYNLDYQTTLYSGWGIQLMAVFNH